MTRQHTLSGLWWKYLWFHKHILNGLKLTGKKIKIRKLRGILIFLPIAWQIHASADEYPFIRLQSDGKSLWLIGSSHIGFENVSTRPKLDTLISGSRGVCLENDPLDNEHISTVQRTTFFNTKNLLLENRLGTKLFNEVKFVLKSSPYSDSSLQKASPFAVTLLMLNTNSKISTMNRAMSPSYSLDAYIFNTAKRYKVPVKGIENKNAVFDAFSSISDKDWQRYTKEFLKMLDCPECVDNYVTASLQAYRGSSDPEHAHMNFLRSLTFVPEAKDIQENILFGLRNVKLADNIVLQFNALNTCDVIAVGAAHLGGQNGLLRLLIDRNISVASQ